jgi:hypothetical protein
MTMPMRARAALLLVPLGIAGCAFGTNRVRLPPSGEIALPAEGPNTAVVVKDGRADLVGAKVGFKRNGYGAKTGDVELDGGEPIADHIASDLVGLLRDRGYRASTGRNTPPPDAELLVDVEVMSFALDVKQGFWSGSLEGVAVLRVTITEARTRRSLWSDIVRAQHTKSGLQMISNGDHQEVAERLHQALLASLRQAVPSRADLAAMAAAS